MAKQIVVLDDGETWSGAGTVWTITEHAYNRLCEGDELKDLSDTDVLDCREVNTDE